MITLENVSFSYGEGEVLERLNAALPHGEISCIMGASGRGKTTLLRLLMGLAEPTEGTVRGLPKHPAVVFQEDRLCEDFSAVANVRIAAKCPKGEAEECLRALDIEDLKSPVKTFSGGMQRRVAIARALCCGGDCLLMDEPFKGLDAELKKKVMDTVARYARGKTLIFVTHDSDEAAYLQANIVNLEALR